MSDFGPDAAVAVVKPDHIGDFVLALPALLALQGRFGTYDLHAAPTNRFLVDQLLPADIRFRPLALEQLSRGRGGLDDEALAERMSAYSLVVVLRSDVGSPELRRTLGPRLVEMDDVDDVHESELERDAVLELTGRYSRSGLVWGDSPPEWPTTIRTLGISLAAGFTSNKLPLVAWVELAQRLRGEGVGIRLLGGPMEQGELSLAARRIGLDERSVFIGSSDLRSFQEQLSECDVVVGADSGTMHLVSLTRPVAGVFTSSPWRRFAPMGPHVRAIVADIACSPCVQYSPSAYNACVWRECAAMVGPDEIASALRLPPGEGIVQLSRNVLVAHAPYVAPSEVGVGVGVRGAGHSFGSVGGD